MSKIQRAHVKFFGFISEKAKTSKWWSALLTFLVLYEIVEHLVWPWLVPYMAYLTFIK
jgi:hypothetical protein